MRRVERNGGRIIATAARLPIYAAIIAAAVLVLAVANDAPHVTPTTQTTSVRTKP